METECLRTVPTNTEVFLRSLWKADLSKGYWNPKKKIGGNHTFLEIILLFLKRNNNSEKC